MEKKASKPAAHKAPVAAKKPAKHLAAKDIKKPAPKKTVISVASGRYFEGVGRRKTSVARVRLVKGEGTFLVNGKDVKNYFQSDKLVSVAYEALTKTGASGFDISVKASGGGISAQAEAVRHGSARALLEAKPEMKDILASLGYLTRDPRMVERKKYGLKKARRAPQWKKR